MLYTLTHMYTINTYNNNNNPHASAVVVAVVAGWLAPDASSVVYLKVAGQIDAEGKIKSSPPR